MQKIWYIDTLGKLKTKINEWGGIPKIIFVDDTKRCKEDLIKTKDVENLIIYCLVLKVFEIIYNNETYLIAALDSDGAKETLNRVTGEILEYENPIFPMMEKYKNL